MTGDDLRECEFSLVRYVPDPVKNEFVNIGVLLREQATPERMELRFTRDWTRVRCIDPQADIGMLEGLEIELRREIGDPRSLQRLQDSFSVLVQLTEPKACLAETFMTQLDQLMRTYVEAPKQPREQRKSGRTAILAEMRRQFEREGVWDLMRKRIAVSKYTRAGDPLRIDCGYRPNGVIRMFQAVSLESDAEAAKGLAFSLPYLTEGVRRLELATLELTAIIEPIREIGDEQERVDLYRFGVETMEQQQIRVLTISDMARVAAKAREEMRT